MHRVLLLLLLFLAASPAGYGQNGPAEPVGLLVELLRWPADAVITDPEPEFSWIVADDRRGAVQTAYRVLVSTSESVAAAEKGDVWDSGAVASNQSVSVSYRGPRLEEHRVYWWRVQTRDAAGFWSPFSAAQAFRTGSFDRSGEAFPGASAWVELSDGRFVLENRQRAHYREVEPVAWTRPEPGVVVADFGRAAFATLKVRVDSPAGGDTVVVFLGERRTEKGLVHKTPGRSSIGFMTDTLVTTPGRHWMSLSLPRHRANYPNSQVLPDVLPEVAPFRFVELRGIPGEWGEEDVRRLALLHPFEDLPALASSDAVLDEVWDLCRYTLRATPFLSLYCDGNRERMPYEADAYIQQLGHYAVDREYAVARYTNQFLLYNPSWPTEWHMHTVLGAWADYLYTGDAEFIRSNHEVLKAKTLIGLADENGLISTRTGRVTPAFLETIHYTGDGFRDIVDWPHGTPAGRPQARNAGPLPEGETDGYVFTDYNTVVNAFHHRTLVLMNQIAAVLGYEEEAAFFADRATNHFRVFNERFFDQGRGIYVDGIGTDHAALHANLFPLAFGLVPPDRVRGVADFVKSRGMACSVYGAQHLLEALFEAGEADHALSLMAADGLRSWRNMIRVGSTMTTEAWDEYYKPNLTWNHAWGSAPANILARKVLGVEPLEPGFASVRIRPQTGHLTRVSGSVPTIRGTIDVSWTVDGDSFRLDVGIPANVRAEVWLPGPASDTVTESGRPLADRTDLGPIDRREGRAVVFLGGGAYRFAGRSRP